MRDLVILAVHLITISTRCVVPSEIGFCHSIKKGTIKTNTYLAGFVLTPGPFFAVLTKLAAGCSRSAPNKKTGRNWDDIKSTSEEIA